MAVYMKSPTEVSSHSNNQIAGLIKYRFADMSPALSASSCTDGRDNSACQLACQLAHPLAYHLAYHLISQRLPAGPVPKPTMSGSASTDLREDVCHTFQTSAYRFNSSAASVPTHGHITACDVQRHQSLEKSGLRFSMKAPKASLAAGSCSMRPKLAPSSAIFCSTAC